MTPFQTTAIREGNDLVAIVPTEVVESLGLTEGAEVSLTIVSVSSHPEVRGTAMSVLSAQVTEPEEA